jgi:hypothetical protein
MTQHLTSKLPHLPSAPLASGSSNPPLETPAVTRSAVQRPLTGRHQIEIYTMVSQNERSSDHNRRNVVVVEVIVGVA